VECVGVLESWVCRVGGGIEDYLESIGREGAGRRNGPGVGPEGVVDTSCVNVSYIKRARVGGACLR
jgi:hypothetical protein